MESIKIIRELGHIYAVALAEKGHDISGETDLMNGLAAYYMLDLKGEFAELDSAVESVLKTVYDLVKENLK